LVADAGTGCALPDEDAPEPAGCAAGCFCCAAGCAAGAGFEVLAPAEAFVLAGAVVAAGAGLDAAAGWAAPEAGANWACLLGTDLAVRVTATSDLAGVLVRAPAAGVWAEAV